MVGDIVSCLAAGEVIGATGMAGNAGPFAGFLPPGLELATIQRSRSNMKSGSSALLPGMPQTLVEISRDGLYEPLLSVSAPEEPSLGREGC